MTAEAMQPSYWQRQYNPRVAIADSQRYFDAWRDRAAQTRRRLAARLNIAYGPGERERLDLFSRHEGADSGTLVFIHGGYWRAFGKEDFSWVADEFVPRGISVAVLSYPLMPYAGLPTIRRSISRAIEHLTTELLDVAERAKLVVVGHSAGAHLAAQYVASSVPPSPRFAPEAVIGVSGLYDLLPVHCAGNLAVAGSNPGELYEASPLYSLPPERSVVLVVVGADESREFQRQSERLVDAWEPRVCGYLRVPQRNHFSVIDDLTDERSELFRKVMGFFGDKR